MSLRSSYLGWSTSRPRRSTAAHGLEVPGTRGVIDDDRVAVGHLAHLIRAVFGDGSAFGVSIVYHQEEEPLGPAPPPP